MKKKYAKRKKSDSQILNEDVKLKEADVKSLIGTMVNRQQFKYTACLIIKYLVGCIWCRNLDKNRHNKSITKTGNCMR